MDGSQTDEKHDCNNEAEEVDNEDEVTFSYKARTMLNVEVANKYQYQLVFFPLVTYTFKCRCLFEKKR